MIIKKFLNIANPKELILRDQMGFVKQLIKASLINFPFQNITSFGAFLPYERVTPGFKQILTASARGEGGLCGHLNNYMKYQLESLGYRTDIMGGCFVRSGIPLSHCILKLTMPGHVLKDPSKPGEALKDKTYLIDVGCGIPLHNPICIEDLPYFGRAGGFDYRYERVDENTMQRINIGGDALIGEKPMDYKSPQDYTIDLTPRNYATFRQPVHAVYSNPRSGHLHLGIYCFRYLDIQDDDFEAVCVRGTELVFITKETRKVQPFGSYEKIKPILLKYFPMINPEEVELAVKNFSIPFEDALKMSSKAK